MDLGQTIKEIRKQKGLKQNQFAHLCDITQAYLSQIENNLKEPNLSTLKVISNKLETPLPILFFLSLDNKDVKPEKAEAFKMIAPSVKSLVNQFFVAQ
ncbi:helix-turn-helix protein [Tenacibaculum skagerrakense]|uniref:Helix-turn-helix protein n=1 Tax=Tenacibaculum skagerrakense TaxID=186571 RepID=A0A4R2NJK6_9FLAO|nr:helix-turn-helix transcriptional regulator [Tenacibaculum skagerrakense]TCP21522.1 helix-turn-helix protein [Tenacibaculum skagerrakense]|tara:strand:- start:1690 stop:1983 length:294 start_codon:yes stop_codon:yes gene_type:complete